MDYRFDYHISAKGAHIFEDGVAIGAQGTQNAVSLTVTFDETWDGLGKIILWFDAMSHDQQVCETALAPSMRVDGDPRVYRVAFPQEIFHHAGKVAIAIEGTETVEEETVVILTTEYGYFRVLASSNDVQDIDPQDNPQTILQQVIELVNEATDARDDAATSETNAAAYASAAQTSASAASMSEANAATSETNAAASASSAQESEGAAALLVKDAAIYSEEAAASAANASASASSASSSATSASASADQAQTCAGNASTSATNAQDSATSAAQSATAAQQAAASIQDMQAITDAELDAICV